MERDRRMEEGEQTELLQRVRDAILKAGGVPTVAARTGIPKKTLEKYLAKRSMASLGNAAKIAEAAGMSLSDLVHGGRQQGLSVPTDVAAFSVSIFTEIHALVDRLHRDQRITLSPEATVAEARRYFMELLRKLDRVGDLDEANALLPWLENRIRQELRDAAAAPGTGKREAS